ncbi:MAG: bifunctional DNA-formamidopyrimidine glycosylase/DNA-(apurinic or apyrimidinic site) lyase [Planctomycetota bacterium]
MPELPEAETIVRQIRGTLRGATLGTVRHLRDEIVRAGGARTIRKLLPGRTVRAVFRRGKRIVLDLDNERRLVFGLGMTGHLAVVPAEWEVAKHTHLRVALNGGDAELRFRDARRFGGIWLLDGADAAAGFARLGVEPLETDLRTFRRILARSRRIKALLMDQAAIAGLGNIYCDEALYRAGIHPLARAADLVPEQVKRLHRAIRRVLGEAIAAEGITIKDYLTAWGESGLFQKRLRVYGREGEKCLKCGTLVERVRAAGRSTYFCPACQPP